MLSRISKKLCNRKDSPEITNHSGNPPTSSSTIPDDPVSDGKSTAMIDTDDMERVRSDKCLCGSPRLDGVAVTGRGSDSLRRKNVEALRLDGELDRRVSCGIAKNEYTKQSIASELRKSTSTSAGESSMQVRGCTTVEEKDFGERRRSDKDSQDSVRSKGDNIRMNPSGSGEERSRKKDEAHYDSTKNKKKEKKGCSDYTALAYDVNYVKVSPPKLTRRMKPPDAPPEGNKKPSREEQLLQRCHDEGFVRKLREVNAPPPSDDKKLDVKDSEAKQSDLWEGITHSMIVGQAKTDSPCGTISKLGIKSADESIKPSVGTVIFEKNTKNSSLDYVSWEDMRVRLNSVDSTTDRNVEFLSPLTTSRKPIDERADFTDDEKLNDSITLIKDGDSSVLKFVFTVRLENDHIRRARTPGGADEVDFASGGDPVVAGTINILQSDRATPAGTVNILQPVIKVGLCNQEGRALIANQAEVVVSSKNEVPPLPVRKKASECSVDTAAGRKCLAEALAKNVYSSTAARRKVDTPPSEKKASNTSSANSTSAVAAIQKTSEQCLATISDTDELKLDATLPHQSNAKPHISTKTNQKDKEGTFRKVDIWSEMSRGSNGKEIFATRTLDESEFTHMSWEEVMQEARTLGIPLNRRGGATEPEQIKSRDKPPRRSSVSSVGESFLPTRPKPDAKVTSSWACPSCLSDTTSSSRDISSPPAAVRAAQQSPLHGGSIRWGSPLKEKIQNLFCRRPPAEEARYKPVPAVLHETRSAEASGSCGKAGCRTLPKAVARHSDDDWCVKSSTIGQRCAVTSRQNTVTSPNRARPRDVCRGCAASNSVLSPKQRCRACGDSGASPKCLQGMGSSESPKRCSHANDSSPPSWTSPKRSHGCSRGAGGGVSPSAGVGGCQGGRKGYGTRSRTPDDELAHTSTIRSTPSDCSTMLTSQRHSTNESAAALGANASFLASLDDLQECEWYWGSAGWEEAEAGLECQRDGSFLVRDSSDPRYIISLSFRSQGSTHHTRIEHYKGRFSFYAQQHSHEAATIVEFIESAMRQSLEGQCLYYLRPRAPGLAPAPVLLLYPLSR